MTFLRKKQQGYTLITLSILFIVMGFFALLIFKIVPIYMDHNKIVMSLSSLKKMPGLENFSTGEVRRYLDARFNTNYVYHVHIRDVEIINRPNYVKIIIEYEVVEPMISNLSILVEFYDVLEVGPK